MNAATVSSDPPRRKQPADQLDRLDGILDALSDGLNGAVAEAAREGTRLAVKDAIVEILTDPNLRASLSEQPMSHPSHSQTSTDAGLSPHRNLTDEQIDRLAEMIADGRCDFPHDLPATAVQPLHREISARLWRRLIQHIARAIADHLQRVSDSHKESTEHA